MILFSKVFWVKKKAPVLLKPFNVRLDLASATLVARLQRSLLKTFQLPNFHPSTHFKQKREYWSRTAFQGNVCSQKVNVFFGILSPPFFGTQKTVPQNLQSLKNPIFFFFATTKKEKKTVPPNRNHPPLTCPPVQVCQRASRNLFSLLKNRCVFAGNIFEKRDSSTNA